MQICWQFELEENTESYRLRLVNDIFRFVENEWLSVNILKEQRSYTKIKGGRVPVCEGTNESDHTSKTLISGSIGNNGTKENNIPIENYYTTYMQSALSAQTFKIKHDS